MTSQLSDFLPYLLNQAAESVSRDFQPNYKDRYGMLRTEWRVLFHLGNHGEMTAKDICLQAALHKTKVSRAVVALEDKRFLTRETLEEDRRAEILTLTQRGRVAFAALSDAATAYEDVLAATLGQDDMAQLKALLERLLARAKLAPAGSSTRISRKS